MDLVLKDEKSFAKLISKNDVYPFLAIFDKKNFMACSRQFCVGLKRNDSTGNSFSKMCTLIDIILPLTIIFVNWQNCEDLLHP